MVKTAKIVIIAALACFLAAAFHGCGGKKSHKAYAVRMSSPNEAERRAAARELRARPRDPKLVPVILQACRDKDTDVRVYGFYAIGKVDPREEGVVAVVIEGLVDTSALVRRAAAEALGELNPFPSACIQAMIGLLVDPDEKVRKVITAVFRDLEGTGAGSLMRHIDNTRNDELRLAIVHLLGSIGPPARIALPRLKKMQQEDDSEELREAAGKAVERIEK